MMRGRSVSRVYVVWPMTHFYRTKLRHSTVEQDLDNKRTVSGELQNTTHILLIIPQATHKTDTAHDRTKYIYIYIGI